MKKLRTKFSYYSSEDTEQELFFICAEILESWDQVRPLENFLMVSAKQRLTSFVREKYYRTSDSDELAEKKRAASHLVKLCDIFEDNFSFEQIDFSDELKHILEELPPLVRADFIRMSNGVKIPLTRKETVFRLVRELFGLDVTDLTQFDTEEA